MTTLDGGIPYLEMNKCEADIELFPPRGNVSIFRARCYIYLFC